MTGRPWGRFLALLILALLIPAPAVRAAQDAGMRRVSVVFFWGNGCPHCEREREFLSRFRHEHPALTVREIEVWKDKGNAERYRALMKAAGVASPSVPATVIGDRLFFGFSSRTEGTIRQALEECLTNGCPDAEQVLAGQSGGMQAGERTYTLPLAGEVDLETVSLPLFTVLLGALDSFNPCAFFVLLFLLSLLAHARSRTRMLVVGGIFVLSSGVIYFLFMAAWLNVFLVAGRLAAITTAAGAVALGVGAVNIKDFFLFKQGVSLSIPESAKPRLFERMRGLVRAEAPAAMLGGAVVLAVTANAYELLCTAGFPMVYTRVLTLHELPPAMYYAYLALYNTVYVLPLAAIVAAMALTAGRRKLTEWEGRQLKLLSGCMMTFLGAVLLVNPELMNSALAAGVLLALSLAATAVASVAAKRAGLDRLQDGGTGQ